MKKLKVRAPAKVNIFLRVLARKPNGYHEIETLFQAIGLEDELLIEKIPAGRELSVPGRKDLESGDNLVMRAVEILEEITGINFPVRITLTKNIPVAAGLGGGSSNAAACLAGVSALFNLNLSVERLVAAGVGLGADVAFFFKGGTAVGRGIGERLSQVETSYTEEILLVNPGFSVSTALIYKECSGILTDGPREGTLSALLDRCPDRRQLLFNDLQPIAESLYPEIREVRTFLEDRGLKALMSGSGPTVFATGDSGRIRKALTDVPEKWAAFLTSPLDRGILIE